MSSDYDSFFQRKPKDAPSEDSKLIEENAKLTLEIKKLRAQCKILGNHLKVYEESNLHCGTCSKPITLEYLKEVSDRNKIRCSDCANKARIQ